MNRNGGHVTKPCDLIGRFGAECGGYLIYNAAYYSVMTMFLFYSDRAGEEAVGSILMFVLKDKFCTLLS